MAIDSFLEQLHCTQQQVYATSLHPNEFVNKIKDLEIGDIVMHKHRDGNNDVYVYNGDNKPYMIDNCCNNSTSSKIINEKVIKMVPKNCINCGAPLGNSSICEYCGTSYE